MGTNMASLRVICAWQIWWPSTKGFWNWWIREDQMASNLSGLVQTFDTVQHGILVSNWRDMDLIDGATCG